MNSVNEFELDNCITFWRICVRNKSVSWLMEAIFTKNKPVQDFILEKIDLNEELPYGKTILGLALKRSSYTYDLTEVIFLIRKGADPDKKNRFGKTPMQTESASFPNYHSLSSKLCKIGFSFSKPFDHERFEEYCKDLD